MKESKILKVLEKVPPGTKLYSTAFGNLEFDSIVEAWGNTRIKLMEDNRDRRIYLPDGRYRKGGEVTLYPSKEMRDWSKFAWKKGDVLVGCAKTIIFNRFTDDTYSYFEGKYCLERDPYSDHETYIGEDKVLLTKYFHTPEKCIAQSFIKNIEERLGGKLNLETLEVKKPKFEDGDILTCPATTLHSSSTFIFKSKNEHGYAYYAAVIASGELYIGSENTWCGKKVNVKYATMDERIKLFDALAKEGKRWNAEKKIIEDIEPVTKSDIPEHKFEPFEKILVRDQKTDKWTVDLYGFEEKKDGYNYQCVGGCFVYCIPYEGNEHLLGTSKDPEKK